VAVLCFGRDAIISTRCGLRPTSSSVSLRAVSIGLLSNFSFLPPGNAICPGWFLRLIDRFVNKISRSFLKVKTGINTLASRKFDFLIKSHIWV
tara:strand:+ start:483 stop:761 length:279 start_codon:yes stop_codon:yes gene_type:complete